MDNKFYAQNTEVANPLKIYGIFKIFSGIFELIIAILILLNIESFIRSALKSSTLDAYSALILLVGLICIIWIIWGLNSIFLGIKNLGNILISPQLPPNFIDYGSVEESLIKRKLGEWSLNSSGTLELAKKYFGNNIIYLKNNIREIVEKNIKFLRNLIIFIFILIIFIFLKNTYTDEISRTVKGNIELFDFPFLFVGLLIFVGIMKTIVLFSIIPKYSPRADVEEGIESIKGAGDPFLLPAEIEKSFLEIRKNGIPNRAKKYGFVETSGGVNDTGKFNGKMFIENQPSMIVDEEIPNFIYMKLILGVFFIMMGSLYTMIPPKKIINLAQTETLLFVLNYFWDLIKGITLINIGSEFFRQTRILVGTFKYESLMTMILFEGTYGRSEIRAGKGINDSFETSNTIVRSDFQAKYYVSKVLSENITLESGREIICMIVDKDVLNTADLLEESVHKFEKSGVAVRGIDINSKGISDLTKANLLYNQQSKMIESKINAPQVQNTIEEKFGNFGRNNSSIEKKSLTPNEDHKVCPDCAETIKANARKCRFCGYTYS